MKHIIALLASAILFFSCKSEEERYFEAGKHLVAAADTANNHIDDWNNSLEKNPSLLIEPTMQDIFIDLDSVRFVALGMASQALEKLHGERKDELQRLINEAKERVRRVEERTQLAMKVAETLNAEQKFPDEE
ncbi:hypothetical protein GCM10023093_12470 [Nemorincola caseinilytica]|uniref:Uncharacterized protein n=1 Tax=Nemorincola caseinilytica TaxID=2054315 RepID=A0ABP8N9J2_9BACT